METTARTLFITGITSGIGQEVLKLALADGFHAVGVVRSEAQKQAMLSVYPRLSRPDAHAACAEILSPFQ
ncbi:MAG: hypothetical protein KGJ21_05845 [Pseudomonadota bacterium]|nr:hypothetical protein [Pseudomonadota bacterium]